MNTESVNLRRVKIPLETDSKTEPGDFAWDFDMSDYADRKTTSKTHFLYVHLPGETNWGAIEVCEGVPGGDRVWGWDGNEDKPTLTPSIHHVGVWHGFLRAGRLESC